MALEGEGLSQFAVGQKGYEGWEGTFKDAEDGCFPATPSPRGRWIRSSASASPCPPMNRSGLLLAGRRPELGRRPALGWPGQTQAPQEPPQTHRRLLAALAPEGVPGAGAPARPVAELYRRSLLVIRTQIDWQGGILAANDSDVVYFNRDTYSYVWPGRAPWWPTPWTRPATPPPPEFLPVHLRASAAGGLPAAQVQSRRHPGLLLAPLVPRGPGPITYSGRLHRPGGLGLMAALRPLPRPGLHQASVPAPGEKNSRFHVSVPGCRDRPAGPLL